ncbi:MAG: serine/threonine-protein kinase [Cyanobacteria bacterium J06649_4]
MAYCFNPVCPQPQNSASANFCQTCGTSLVLDGRYRLQSVLGQGGFGRTFLAVDVTSKATTQQCVIKQIYRSAVTGEANFRSEADRLRELGKHRQIPRLLAVVENELGQFLVQEFAPGQTLQQLVDEDGPWEEGEVRSLLKSLVDVLQYVHSFQIIHRDIKPDNIIYAANKAAGGLNREQPLPMLVDFGAAKWVRNDPAKTVIGSAGYAAPEQSMGQATFASDIYSLGLTCLHLLTGVHPFTLYSMAEDKWVWQDYLAKPLDPRLAQVLDRMVARSLQQRYETMAQVSIDLQFSQNSLVETSLEVSKKLVEKARESVPGLKQLTQADGVSGFGWLLPKSEESPAALPVAAPTAQSWRRVYRLAPDIGVTQALAISPDGQTLASGGTDGAVRLWQLESGELWHTFPRRRLLGNGHGGAITALAFHPDSRALYSASVDGMVKEWDSQACHLLNTLPLAGWTPMALQVTADGSMLASPYSDGTIVVWEIATLLPATTLTQHQKGVNAIALSPDSHLLASIDNAGILKLWTGQAGRFRLAKTITDGIGRKGVFLGLVPLQTPEEDGAFCLVVGVSNSLQLYRLEADLTVSEPLEIYQSAQRIKAMALSKQGTIAVATEASMVTLWDINSGDCVATLAHDWGLETVAFSPDGQTLVAASTDEVISIWRCDSAIAATR